MKKILITIMTVILTILFLIGAAVGIWLYRRYTPSRVQADLEQWFGAEGDQVAVILNNELEEGVKGRMENGQVYLPLTWVNANLNERFYWDSEQHQLIYALPESIVYADAATTGRSGSPLLIEKDEEVWLLTDLILAYTDIRIQRCLDDSAKRVFVDTGWEPVLSAPVRKDGKLRVRGGIKSEILTELVKNENVEILEAMDNWSKVRTETGYIGYVPNKLLGEASERVQISTFEAPVYRNISMDEPVCLVWHQVTTAQANQKMAELMANTSGVNVIAPTWFMLTDNEGNYDCLADADYVDQAHAMGLQVWAAVDNFNRGDNVQSEVLFASTKARRNLIRQLIADVQAYGIDGLNLDIEGIKPSAGPHYIQFIRELSVNCRKNGIVLSVDSYVPSAYTAFYNRAEQGRVADYVIIMGYDEHHAGGEAGSVASLGYEKKGIEDTLREVPADKLISAIPFYTRVWNITDAGTTSTAMGITAAKQWVEENNVELSWQEDLGQYYGEIERDGGTYCIWMEEERSIEKKMELIRQNNLAGVACWKLGFEPQDIWEIVKQ